MMHLVAVDSDRNWLVSFIQYLQAVQSNVEKVSLALRDVQENYLASDSRPRILLDLLDRGSVRTRSGFLFLDSRQLLARHSYPSNLWHDGRGLWPLIEE